VLLIREPKHIVKKNNAADERGAERRMGIYTAGTARLPLTKIVRREQDHLAQKVRPAHENTGAATTKRR
jgi:hypothetical protein